MKTEKLPKPGFYYHYKHDPAKGAFDHAYEVIGIGHDAQKDGFEEEEAFVIYRPLYESSEAYQAGGDSWIRPRDNFLEILATDKHSGPRFLKIEDRDTILLMREQKNKMYKR